MFRLSGDFIYTLAGELHPLSKITETSTRLDVFLALNTAEGALRKLLPWNPLGLGSSWTKGSELQTTIKRLVDSTMSDPSNLGEAMSNADVNLLKTAFVNFEVTLKADLSVANFYAVTNKGAYNTAILAEYGLQAFPEGLAEKVPDAAPDARQGARCLAFDLPTAAAFHMHRAHEAVVHAYFKAFAPKVAPPEKKPLSVWLEALEKADAPKEIVSSLRDLNTLHRNPVLHPEIALSDVGEAIALLGSIHTTMKFMLKIIPIQEGKTA